MNNTYLLVDTYNTFFRSIHATAKGSDIEEKVAFAIHSTFQSIAAAWRDQNATHVVVCLEGKSWRKDFYKPYKAQRVAARMAQTEKEKEEGEQYFAALSEMIDLLTKHSNVTTLIHPNLEADDLIQGWIHNHPDDKHVIVSTDTDYYQLLAENVSQYSGVARELHTVHGIYDYKGKRVIDKKTKLPKEVPDPKWILFEKCVRGDATDNVFSAYPGVRTKGSKNKVGLTEAFADRDAKGFNWNNLMLQRWTDHNKVEHRVLDDYNRNVTLVDLSAQPANIRAMLDEYILKSATVKQMPMIGAHFLKFCGKYNLVKLSENSNTYASILSAHYKG